MSEFAEAMAFHRAHRQQRRASNREGSAAMLDAAGITYELKNSGAHLIVRHDGLVVDFWPGTGKFTVRGEKDRAGRPVYQRGVRSLLKRLGAPHA